MQTEETETKYRLTVRLRGGKSLQGEYDWLGAQARIEAIMRLPSYKSHQLEQVAPRRGPDRWGWFCWIAVYGSGAYLLAQLVRSLGRWLGWWDW